MREQQSIFWIWRKIGAFPLLFLIVTPFLFIGCASMNSTPSPPASQTFDLERDLIEQIQSMEKKLSCRVGVSYRDPAVGAEISHRGDEMFHAASTMKVPVLIEVFRQAEAGEISLEAKVPFDPRCESFLDGSIFLCDAGPTLEDQLNQDIPIRTLAREMMVVSDNLATNILIELCGHKRITATMRELGAKDGYVIRGVQDEEAYRAGISNRITANDLSLMMEAIDQGRAAGKDSTDTIKEILLAQRYQDKIPGKLPAGVRVGNKTGSISETRHDTAIIFTPEGNYYLTILMDQLENTKKGTEMAADLSRWIYDRRTKILKKQ